MKYILKKDAKDWKMSEIILIFKKANKHNIENYQPVSFSLTIVNCRQIKTFIGNAATKGVEAGFQRN